MTDSYGWSSRFVTLLVANQRRVHGFIRTLIWDTALAEDVLQESCMTAWAKFGEVEKSIGDSDDDFARWLCTIARFKCLAALRKQRRDRHEVFTDDLAEKLADLHLSRLEDVDARHKALSACMEKLPEKQRKLVERRYSVESSPRDIAKELGRPVTSVYKLLHRLRRDLQDCIRRSIDLT